MLATETRVQVSILGYLSSDLKEAVCGRRSAVGRSQEIIFIYCPHTLHPTPYTLHPTPYTPHPTPHTLHPTPYTPHPTPYFPEKAYSAIQAKKNETFALRISPDW
ncbi:MAG: hypothetical protein EWV80_05120 [Microcystis aeruginosa Ma_QC_B_20070730_S2]|uniref:Uncharacterized protein n=1 Tax=Microcystis aeruginosa Ma_QC_B_20070730_S2 TaxID=2486256 RepID=A0A552E2F3_MICAE|nr:MAG: hypothetical protein EWV80_05120 [Microcystis aeruginosa Ma_QC_B_20070730_S2]